MIIKRLSFVFVSIAFAAAVVHAQNYSIDWSKIAGGGGTSGGGTYAVTGTIGQPDAGKMTNGNYSLEGGFISGLVLVQTPGAPQLSMTLSAGNALISWPAADSGGYILQEAINLNSPASWGNSSATVNITGNLKSVTVPAAGMKFYRLQKP